MQSAAGMPRRSPSKKEEEPPPLGVPVEVHQEMLTAAYERCVDNTGKFSAGYINKILEGWHRSGVRNLRELEQLEARKREDRGSGKSYDIEELERMSFLTCQRSCEIWDME